MTTTTKEYQIGNYFSYLFNLAIIWVSFQPKQSTVLDDF